MMTLPNPFPRLLSICLVSDLSKVLRLDENLTFTCFQKIIDSFWLKHNQDDLGSIIESMCLFRNADGKIQMYL